MAQIYVNLINLGLKTIENVPLVIRPQVQAILDEQNNK